MLMYFSSNAFNKGKYLNSFNSSKISLRKVNIALFLLNSLYFLYSYIRVKQLSLLIQSLMEDLKDNKGGSSLKTFIKLSLMKKENIRYFQVCVILFSIADIFISNSFIKQKIILFLLMALTIGLTLYLPTLANKKIEKEITTYFSQIEKRFSCIKRTEFFSPEEHTFFEESNENKIESSFIIREKFSFFVLIDNFLKLHPEHEEFLTFMKNPHCFSSYVNMHPKKFANSMYKFANPIRGQYFCVVFANLLKDFLLFHSKRIEEFKEEKNKIIKKLEEELIEIPFDGQVEIYPVTLNNCHPLSRLIFERIANGNEYNKEKTIGILSKGFEEIKKVSAPLIEEYQRLQSNLSNFRVEGISGPFYFINYQILTYKRLILDTLKWNSSSKPDLSVEEIHSKLQSVYQALSKIERNLKLEDFRNKIREESLKYIRTYYSIVVLDKKIEKEIVDDNILKRYILHKYNNDVPFDWRNVLYENPI